MIHKHDIRTAISDLRQALEHVEHYSNRPEVFCLKQLLVNPLAYLLSEMIIRAEQEESRPTVRAKSPVQQAQPKITPRDTAEYVRRINEAHKRTAKSKLRFGA